MQHTYQISHICFTKKVFYFSIKTYRTSNKPNSDPSVFNRIHFCELHCDFPIYTQCWSKFSFRFVISQTCSSMSANMKHQTLILTAFKEDYKPKAAC